MVKRALAGALVRPARGYVRHAPVRALKPLLVRRLLEPTLRSRPREFVTSTIDGFRLGGTTRDMIERYVYVFGVWEPHVTAWMRRRLLPGRTLVDVGANVGYFTLLGAQLLGPQGRVVAVEALPATYARLEANLALNGTRNVRGLNVAATAAPGTVTLFGGERHNSGTTSTIAAAGLTRLADVEGAPLAQLLTAEEVATARIIKIDVEGAELDVLEGLEPSLPAMPDDVELVVEVSPEDMRAAGRAPTAPFELLAEHGFTPYRIRNDYAPVSYTSRRPPAPPERLRDTPATRIDVVFSRTSAETLP